LVNKGTEEPYRMFTSRAEYRILLRQDNADLRLTPIAARLGMLGADERMERVNAKQAAATAIEQFCRQTPVLPETINDYLLGVDSAAATQKVKLYNILLRPQVDLQGLSQVVPELGTYVEQYEHEFTELAEINMKYDGYIQKERDMVEKVSRLENLRLSEEFNYHGIPALSFEARQKLSKIKPSTLGQASRISGVTPADVSVLLVHLGR
jgi:tRNA uridine 5-carboxymethylaminomethyl modification enzyme